MHVFNGDRAVLGAAVVATMAALCVAASPADAHDRHEHVVLRGENLGRSPSASRARKPHSARSASNPRARRAPLRARLASHQGGIPEHQSQLGCSVVNGVGNFEGQAVAAGGIGWSEPASYGVSITSNQYVYFRMWSGRQQRRRPRLGDRQWARSRIGAAYNWEAYLGGRWVNQTTGTYGILRFALSSYIGGLSYVREPVNATRRVYFEWQWSRFDANWRFTGQWVQHWDYLGDRYCAA